MGNWKYLNLLVILVMLFFMFGALLKRYAASGITYLMIIAGIVILTISGCYIFIIKIGQSGKGNETVKHFDHKEKNLNAVPRPKVVLKPKTNKDQK